MDDSEWTIHASLRNKKRKENKNEKVFNSLCRLIETNDFEKAEGLLCRSQVNPDDMLVDACKREEIKVVQFLITNSVHPANVNADKRQTRPIWEAIETENLELIKLLLQKATTCMKVVLECRKSFSSNRNPLIFPKDFMLTPLIRTIELGNFAIAQELILAGADVNAQCFTTNSNGPTEFTFPPIVVAATGYRLDMCKLLLKHGCDVTACERPTLIFAAHLYPYTHVTALDQAAYFADHCSSQSHDYRSEWMQQEDPGASCEYAVVELLLKHMPKNNFSSAMEMFIDNFDLRGVDLKGVKLLLAHGYKWQVHWNSVRISDELMQIIQLPDTEAFFITMLEYGYQVSSSSDHFHSAAKKGLVGLIYSMLEVNPQCLQQKWLNDCKDFGELPEKAVAWLLANSKQPVSLQHFCKARIWQHLASLSDHHCYQVHIPSLIEQMSVPLMHKRNLQLLSISDAREMILDDTPVE